MLTPFNPAYNSIPLPANLYERGPDESEDKPVCRCSECGEDIFFDERVWVFGDKVFCEACIEAHCTYARDGRIYTDKECREEHNAKIRAFWEQEKRIMEEARDTQNC